MFEKEPRWYRQLIADLKRHEGCLLKPYKDTVGVWTIGYGHTKGVKQNSKPITEEEALDLLVDDTEIAIEDARRVVASFDGLDWVRKTVVANMAYNLGGKRLSGFHNTINYINNGEYNSASLNMLASRWAKQVKGRATELALRMGTGVVQDKHKVE